MEGDVEEEDFADSSSSLPPSSLFSGGKGPSRGWEDPGNCRESLEVDLEVRISPIPKDFSLDCSPGVSGEPASQRRTLLPPRIE